MGFDLKSSGFQRESLRIASTAATFTEEPVHPRPGVLVFGSLPLETFEDRRVGGLA